MSIVVWMDLSVVCWRVFMVLNKIGMKSGKYFSFVGRVKKIVSRVFVGACFIKINIKSLSLDVQDFSL